MRSAATDLRGNGVPNSVSLIGVDERSPHDYRGQPPDGGSHVVSPAAVNETFRFYCGLSPEMTNCCWYRTDLKNLCRYAGNIVRYMFQDRDCLVQRTLRDEVDGLSVR